MPSLAETQLPQLRRDIRTGNLLKRDPTESEAAYHKRLADEYFLTVEQIVFELIA